MALSTQKESQVWQAICQVVTGSHTLRILMLAQARHETGNFTSKAFLQNNNLFGYKYVQGGKYQVGKGRGADDGGNYAIYANYTNSVAELVAWHYRRQKEGKYKVAALTDVNSYVNALVAGSYFTASVSAYRAAMQSHFNTVLKQAGSTATASVLIPPANNTGQGKKKIAIALLAIALVATLVIYKN